jgi:hypothetical protein
LRLPNSKKNQPKFWQIHSPENSFAKTSSALKPRHLPEYLEGRVPQKNVPFLLEEKVWRAQNQKSREHFSAGYASEASGGGAFVERTI